MRNALPGPARVALIMCSALLGCAGGFRQRSAAEILADTRYVWLTDTTAHTRLHYIAGTPAADSLARLKKDSEASWASAATFIGGAPVERVIDVFAVPKREMVGEAARLPVLTNALNLGKQRVIIAWVTARAAIGPHEFVHIMATDAWGMPREWWLGEGVAVAAGAWNGVDVDRYTKCLSDAGHLLPLRMIVPGLRNPDERTSRVAYPEAGSFVRFLLARSGRETLARLYSAGASAVPSMYGSSLAELEGEWRQHLASVDASGVRCAVA